MDVRLEPVHVAREAEFLRAVRRSEALHRPWVSPPRTAARFREFAAPDPTRRRLRWFVLAPDGALAGVIEMSEIVRGAFKSAYLGYYAFEPHAGRGLMTAGLREAIRLAFGTLRLHRLEANIQPGNVASIALVRRLGFRKEGYSPRYLKIRGRWRDHERWAITVEERTRPSGADSSRRSRIPRRRNAYS